jgi:uncharacterized protein with HEPN domain
MPHSVRKLLLDISISCEEIQQFSAGLSFEQFHENRVLQLALEREFEIIGEALSRLERVDPETIAKRIPEYRKIIGFRNILAHGYDIVDEASLWDFVKNRVPDLLNEVHAYE